MSDPLAIVRHMDQTRASRLASVPLFRALPPDRLEHLAARATTKRVASNAVLLHAGSVCDHLLLIDRGQVALSHELPDGRSAIVAIAGRNTTLCVESVLERPSQHLAVTLQRCVVVAIPTEHLRHIVAANAPAALAVAEHFAEGAAQLERALRDVLLLSAAGRVASRLCDLAERHGFPAPDGRALPSPPKHDHLAALTGLSRETVSRALAAFRHAGLLTSAPGMAVIHDLAALRALAEAQP